jgi:hypothetical protein
MWPPPQQHDRPMGKRLCTGWAILSTYVDTLHCGLFLMKDLLIKICPN